MRKSLLVILLFSFIGLPTLTTAQDGWQTYTSEGGSSFSYPSDWTLAEFDEIQISNNSEILDHDPSENLMAYPYESGDIAMSIGISDEASDEDSLQGFIGADTSIDALTPDYFGGISTMITLLTYSFGGISDASLDIKSLSRLDIPYNNHLTVLSNGTIDIYILSIIDGNNIDNLSMGMISIFLPSGEFDQHEETVMQIIESIELIIQE